MVGLKINRRVQLNGGARYESRDPFIPFGAIARSPPSYGVDLFGRATTQLACWQDRIDRETKFAGYQYLRVGALDVVKGRDISVLGYGRYGLNEAADPDANGRLYYFYVDWRDAWKSRMDLRLGRQWINLVADSRITDGAQVDFKIGLVGVVLLGGRDVIFDEFEFLKIGEKERYSKEI